MVHAENLIDANPCVCPLCKHAINPESVGRQYWYRNAGVDEESWLDVAFVCPRLSCRRIFVSSYIHDGSDEKVGEKKNFIYRYSIPNPPEEPTHDDVISSVSPSFVELYRQASDAEAYRLGDIAGGGYRKALEFLIKDYCIGKNPDKETKIRKLQLAAVINNFVEDANIKVCASRAAWLGNDETHYERRWVDKDIEDMKVLIQLTCNWIVNEALTEKYLAEMPAKDSGSLT